MGSERTGPQGVPESAIRAAERIGGDLRVGIVAARSAGAREASFSLADGGAGEVTTERVRRTHSILAGVLQRRGPLVVNDLGEPRFDEERLMAGSGIRGYVALRSHGAGGPAVVVFASTRPGRFDAVTVGALVGYLEEPSPTAPGPGSPAAETAPAGVRETVVGESEAFLEICRLIAIVARQDTTVLIQGESGTGKEVLAKTIHRYSERSERPFVRVNCAALAENLVESEMFGHRKGAFTGAIYSNKGRFEMADGGTLLLDEIGTLSLTGQAKLLRVLQEQEFEPVGQSSSVSVDVRIIATTNVDLEREIRTGNFREDLYYRLAVVPITVPPLRERKKDIVPLAEHFLGLGVVALGKPPVELMADARELLLAYDWPGNARELRNAMEYAALVSRGGKIGAADLPAQVSRSAMAAAKVMNGTLRERLQQYERQIVLDAFEQAGGVRKRVASILGIDPRNVSYFLRKHDIG